jgi:predicted transposase/invertase (TIGR01784 family)
LAINRLKPKNDFVFGRLFGEKESKESLISLLNAILRQNGNDPIVELKVIENKQLKKQLLNDKTGRLDIRAELESGEQINIEMQIANRHNMTKRTLFYLTKLFTASIKTGEPFEKLKKTIAINLLDFELFTFERFHSIFHLYEDHEEHVMLTDVLEVHFIEFPKFERVKKDTSIALHRWLLFLDEKLPEEELKELMRMDPAISKTEEHLELLSSDELTRQLAEARGYALSEWHTQMNGSRAEGRAEGKAEGEAKGKAIIIARLLKKGMDPAFISEATGLSLTEIERIALTQTE